MAARSVRISTFRRMPAPPLRPQASWPCMATSIPAKCSPASPLSLLAVATWCWRWIRPATATPTRRPSPPATAALRHCNTCAAWTSSTRTTSVWKATPWAAGPFSPPPRRTRTITAPWCWKAPVWAGAAQRRARRSGRAMSPWCSRSSTSSPPPCGRCRAAAKSATARICRPCSAPAAPSRPDASTATSRRARRACCIRRPSPTPATTSPKPPSAMRWTGSRRRWKAAHRAWRPTRSGSGRRSAPSPP